MTTAARERDPLRRIKPGEYENGCWTVTREAEDDGSDDFAGNGKVRHPFGYDYMPALVYSWYIHNKASGDFYDAFPTLREARAFTEYAR